MKKVIKLKESDLQRIVKRVLTESYEGGSIQQGDDSCKIRCKIKLAKSGSNGDVVKYIQHLLAANGFNPKYQGGGMGKECSDLYQGCDGKYRKHTKDAVMEFQRKYKLTVDGVVGYNTLMKMCEVFKPGTGTRTETVKAYDLLCKDCDCKKQKDKNKDDRGVGDKPIETPIGGGNPDNWWEYIVDPIKDVWDWINLPDEENSRSKNCDRVNYCVKYAMGKDSKNWEFFLECIGKKIKNPITNPKPKKGCQGCPKYVWGGYQVIDGDESFWERKKRKDECVKNKCSIFTKSDKLLKDHPEWFEF
tara:strand:- start:270 stop:1178 length:909 start_codon:yes stop_codon:yes gene_type:complete